MVSEAKSILDTRKNIAMAHIQIENVKIIGFRVKIVNFLRHIQTTVKTLYLGLCG